jgi:sugar phosphate isomerase/epimerase
VRFACSTASFPEDRLEIAIAKTGWAGYQGVELSLPAELPTEEELRYALRANELELAAIHAGELPAGGEPVLEALGHFGRAAALTRALDGSSLVVTVPAEGSLDALVSSLRLLDRALRDVAVDLCLANRAESLLSTPDAFAELWRLRLPERVGIALDPGQALLAGWDPVQLDALPELPRHVYLTDAAGGRLVPPGEGTLDLDELGTALRQVGYGGSVVLLLQHADPWAVEPLAKELREVVGTW